MGSVKFKVHGNKRTGKIIDNKLSTLNVWNFQEMWNKELPEGTYQKELPFAEYAQFMTATGGSKERDLFVNPMNFDVLDDYDFEPLVTACRNVLHQGLVPFIKTGNVPLKYSAYPPKAGPFRVNIYAPKDYQIYYDYIKAMAEELLAAFGIEELKRWRWGVFTEYENEEWFIGDPSKESACEAFCKIYDYTVGALTGVLGDDIYIGAHSMTCCQGNNALWDEEEFIRHCAYGPNYENGKSFTRLCYLTSSFYDITPSQLNFKSMVECIRELKNCAESYGLQLVYGIDEGRILNGVDGLPLVSRIVGQTYQAGYDANILRDMINHDISWFSAWGYTSGTQKGPDGERICGLPTVSYHVADCFYKMCGCEETVYEKVSSDVAEDIKVDMITAWDRDAEKCYCMAYCYKHDMEYDDIVEVTCDVDIPNKREAVKVTTYLIDDDCNFFPKWRSQVTQEENDTGWSLDSVSIKMPFDIAKYEQYSHLVPTSTLLQTVDGSVTLRARLRSNAVVMYVIENV